MRLFFSFAFVFYRADHWTLGSIHAWSQSHRLSGIKGNKNRKPTFPSSNQNTSCSSLLLLSVRVLRALSLLQSKTIWEVFLLLTPLQKQKKNLWIIPVFPNFYLFPSLHSLLSVYIINKHSVTGDILSYSFFFLSLSLSLSLFVLYFVDFWMCLSAVRVLGCHTIKKKGRIARLFI